MDICIFGKTSKINSHKTVSKFTQQLLDCFKYLSQDKTQRLNCVMGYFKEPTIDILVDKLAYHFVVRLNERARRKLGILS